MSTDRSPVIARQRALLERVPRWIERTLDGQLDWTAANFGDRSFVIGEAKTLTYAEMADWSRRVAAGLVQLGVSAGDKVAIVMANYPEFVALKFAIARVGAVAVPVNVLNRRDELGYVLRQSNASVLVTMGTFRDLDYCAMLDELAPGWETGGGGSALPDLRSVILFEDGDGRPRVGATYFTELSVHPPYQGASLASGADLADIIYTSGTTGPPKGVMLTHDMLLRTAFASALSRAFEDGRRVLFALPMYHVFGYVEGLLSVLFVGGAVIPRTRFDAGDMLDAAQAHRATDMLAVPAMTLAMIDEQRTKPRDLSSVRSILSSGTRSPERVWQEIESVLGIAETTTGYGMTEVTASSTVTRPDDPLAKRLTTNGRLRDAGPAGDPHLGGRLVDYRIVDPATGTAVGPSEIGELRARGPGVTSGYYEMPGETARAFDADGWLRTGDLGSIDDDGYVVLAGRLKESYRCGGEQVLPSEVEDVLTARSEVQQAHVVPLPDERMGEIGVAFVVLSPGRAIDAETLLDHCRNRLARFKVPRHLLFIDPGEIPTTASGRARKFLLADIAKDRLERHG